MSSMQRAKKNIGLVPRRKEEKFRSVLLSQPWFLSLKKSVLKVEQDLDSDVVMVDTKSTREDKSIQSRPSSSASPGETPLLSSSTSFAHTLMDPNVRYRFRICNWGSLSSNTSGTLQSSISVDPSVGSLSDWTHISGLFDEVRLIRSRITLVSVQIAGASGNDLSYLVGYARSLTSSTTLTSYDAVAALPDSSLHPRQSFASAGRVVKEAEARNSLWAPIGTPAGTPDVGCTGAWCLYTSGADASERIIDYLVEMFIECRARA